MTDPQLQLNDGRAMPQIGFGLWEVPADQTARVVRDGLAAGYRLVDGAAIYGNERGLGEGLRAGMDELELRRDDVFVTTKVWNDAQGRDAARRAIDESLARIGVDHLDLVLIHWPCPARALYVDTWRALIAAREAGAVRSIGVSNFTPEHLARIVGETGVVPAVNQIELHPELQQREARAEHERRGIVTQDWTPLGRGRSFDAAPVRAAAERAGKTPAQVVLRWHVQLGASVIPRTTRAERLRENRDVLDFELTEAEMAGIAALDVGRRIGPHPDAFG